ncbi:hypothetical protein CYMTET_43473 [Cymbomonas tetramitiformis]|uniref:Uncharacterized protein n=1 Tax=Cymbomonas tetramitiformis TaxID=36881 RepID=A0AAE0C260_9CHLO|nr:hypothetical protein CYMTET_43473 [Cymbomonas tetramitiformis]
MVQQNDASGHIWLMIGRNALSVEVSVDVRNCGCYVSGITIIVSEGSICNPLPTRPFTKVLRQDVSTTSFSPFFITHPDKVRSMGRKKKSQQRERAQAPKTLETAIDGDGVDRRVNTAESVESNHISQLATSVRGSLTKLNDVVRTNEFKTTCDEFLHSCAENSSVKPNYEILHEQYETIVETTLAKAVGEEELAAKWTRKEMYQCSR